MPIRRVWLVPAILITLLAITPAVGQTGYLDEPGIPAFTTAFPVEHGFINLSNGALHIEIPVSAYDQRGNHRALNARLVYDSRFWIVRTDPVSDRQSWASNGLGPVGISVGGGFRLITDLEPGFANESFSGAQCGCITNPGGGGCSPRFKTTYTGFFYQEANGTKHSLRNFKLVQKDPSCVGISDPGNATVRAADNSGYEIVITNYAISAVYGPDGTQVFPSVQDTNGNYFSQDANSNVIDTLGRTPVVVTQSGDQTFLDYLCAQGCNPGNGDRARVTVNNDQQYPGVQTQFNQSGVAEFSSGAGKGLRNIVFPDGSTYSFTYDSYGMITGMTLPTGGQISYGYTNVADYNGNINRWVISRVADGQTWSFTPVQLPCSTPPCPQQVTVTTPSYSDGSTTASDNHVYTFSVENAGVSAGAWNTQVQYFRGSTSGTPLITKNIDYNTVGPPVPIRETVIWPTPGNAEPKSGVRL